MGLLRIRSTYVAARRKRCWSFTHSRLVRYRTGPGVKADTFPLEGDLAESWQQTSDTTYVFRLRRGVRFHKKPPVNGRELTAEDVRFSIERLPTAPGAGNAAMLRPVDRVEAVDRYTVKLTLKEPFAWLLDTLANPMAVAIAARECVEKLGDLKKPESVVGTGPWMLESYKPNISPALQRNPSYFVAGLPYIDRVELLVDEDNASRMAAFLAGKYDLGWEFPGTINRTDWVQIRDQLKHRRPGLERCRHERGLAGTPGRGGAAGGGQLDVSCQTRTWPAPPGAMAQHGRDGVAPEIGR